MLKNPLRNPRLRLTWHASSRRLARVVSTASLAVAFLLSGPVSAQTVEYFHTDALGSPVAVTDQSRAIVQRSHYAPYGELLNRGLETGPGYTGHVTDAATQLNYMQQRYYDSQIGIFLSVDPVGPKQSTGENFSRYWYAADNPYKYTDPDGRFQCFSICRPWDDLPITSSTGMDGSLRNDRIHYSTKDSSIIVGPDVSTNVIDTADAFYKRTGKDLVVTSATRNARSQAEAIADKITLGEDIRKLYRNKTAAAELLDSFKKGGLTTSERTSALEQAIQSQMDRGILISDHLKSTAIDYRDKDLGMSERSDLRTSALESGATKVLREGKPPHTHVEY